MGGNIGIYSIMLICIFSLFFFSYSCSPLATSTCSGATFENGKKYQMVETTTRVKMVTEEEDGCQVMLNVLLVGGGGDEELFLGHGGGSGFVDFKQVLVESSDLLSVSIGRAGNFGTSGDPTTLEIYGGDLLLGVPGGVGGEDGGGNGGNGYSGGGGGGANGFPAGAGGIGSGFYGGGGGGVVVVGDERQHQKAEEGNGEGYGGGGGSSGSKGVALLEIVDSLKHKKM